MTQGDEPDGRGKAAGGGESQGDGEAQTAAAQQDEAQRAGAGEQALPLFYKEVRALDASRHAAAALGERPDMRFAAATDSLPLTVAEFDLAARHYPIVFGQATPHLPIAVVGLRRGENAFVDGDGRWDAETYVPAYVRRYPFLLAEDREAGRVALCIDEACPWLGEGAGKRLFDDDGQPSEIAKQAFEFCRAFHQQTQGTRSFVEALTGAGLLAESKPRIPLADGRSLTLQGFLSIDRDRLDNLSDATFLELRRQGWLAAVYAQLQSQHNWSLVLRRAALRNPGAPIGQPAEAGSGAGSGRSR